MGLDISAYKQLQKIDAVFDADGEPIDPITKESIDYDLHARINSDFPGRNGQIENNAVYVADNTLCFSAGSYSGYGRWRETLAKISGWPEKYSRYHDALRHSQSAFESSSGPFWELINFSDCEGIIGAEASQKLSIDFAKYDEIASKECQVFYDKYKEWRSAFEMASENGAVKFF